MKKRERENNTAVWWQVKRFLKEWGLLWGGFVFTVLCIMFY